MYFSEWKEEDGYYESLLSFEKGFGPILRVRAVLQSNRLYSPVIRDYETGRMVVSSSSIKQLSDTILECIILVRKYIQHCLEV